VKLALLPRPPAANARHIEAALRRRENVSHTNFFRGCRERPRTSDLRHVIPLLTTVLAAHFAFPHE
jgi:hypothetical protein